MGSVDLDDRVLDVTHKCHCVQHAASICKHAERVLIGGRGWTDDPEPRVNAGSTHEADGAYRVVDALSGDATAEQQQAQRFAFGARLEAVPRTRQARGMQHLDLVRRCVAAKRLAECT
jgi:hypothetical protein